MSLPLGRASLAGAIGPVVRVAAGFLRSLYQDTDMLVLRAPARRQAAAHVQVVERTATPGAPEAACVTLHRRVSRERHRARLRQGLRYFELLLDGQLVGSTWIIGHGTRFIDEAGYHLHVPDGTFWVRDIFIAPEARGRKLLGTFLDALLLGPLQQCDAIWSDVTTDNISSLRAHEQYGFHEMARILVMH